MNKLHYAILNHLSPKAGRSIFSARLIELLAFTYKQALCCLFPIFVFLMLATSHYVTIIPRYDFMLITCLGMQIYMYKSGLESKHEVLVILVFHLLGLVMELHKVNVGSWSYPEFAYVKIGNVPLYSGFMYASVASYICQSWTRMKLNMINWPKLPWTILVGSLIYFNFFTNAYVQDIRWFIVPILLFVFRKNWVEFNNNGVVRKMPMLVSFFLIGFFIWLAESIATFLGAWKYTYQHAGWEMVHWQKLSSWALLVIVSVIIVAQLKNIKYGK